MNTDIVKICKEIKSTNWNPVEGYGILDTLLDSNEVMDEQMNKIQFDMFVKNLSGKTVSDDEIVKAVAKILVDNSAFINKSISARDGVNLWMLIIKKLVASAYDIDTILSIAENN